VRQHQGLVHAVLRRQVWNDIPYEDLFQEGAIALWQAILHFDPQRGVAFSTFAWTVISRRFWQAIARLSRPQGYLPLPEPEDPAVLAETAWRRERVRELLAQALAQLPKRLAGVIRTHYGLAGYSPHSLAALGRAFGLSRERMRQLRNDALVLLRLPALSWRLRLWCDQNTRSAYARARALNRAWLSQKRRKL
jgi:RNA polymerase sigma factor (sigma-70 family)